MNPEGDRCELFVVQRSPHFYKEVKSVKKCYGVRRIFSALLALAMLLVLAPAAAAQENAVTSRQFVPQIDRILMRCPPLVAKLCFPSEDGPLREG